MSQLYVLFEHAVGYCLFRVKEFEEIGSFLPQVEEAVSDVTKFKKVVHHVGFRAFKNAATALANINAVSEGIVTQELSAFLETNMPKPGKKDKVSLGVCDPKLGAAISETLGYSILHTGVVPEVLRGIRCHLDQFIKGLNSASMKQSELGLGHSYSRGKVKFNIHKVDNMIIQSIALLDQLDKDINTFSMRIREWYSYHFPELAKVVTDNYQYALCAHLIKNRNTLSPEMLDQLEEITNDSAKAQSILDVAKMSMGMDIAPLDLLNIEIFAKRVAGLAEYRKSLSEYLKNKMKDVAPNLLTLIGESVGARLISHAGSLTNLAKCPASTVQILGAEKALFRALKLRTATPKYGLIYHSTFIGKAGSTNKGRISRYLANKCSLASRIDCFSEVPTSVFGEKLRDQVEERLKFYESGDLPRKNVEVMIEAVEENAKVVKKIQRKRKKSAALDDTQEFNGSLNAANCNEEEENGQMPSKKKKKKDKKNKLNLTEEFQPEMSPVPTPVEEETPGKKRKKNKKKFDEEEQEFSPPVLLDSTKKKNKKMKLEPEGGEEDTMIDSSFLNDSKIEASSGKKKKKNKKNKKNSMPVGNESSS